jgi:hypothetical protein
MEELVKSRTILKVALVKNWSRVWEPILLSLENLKKSAGNNSVVWELGLIWRQRKLASCLNIFHLGGAVSLAYLFELSDLFSLITFVSLDCISEHLPTFWVHLPAVVTMFHNILISVLSPTFLISRSVINDVIFCISDILSIITKYSSTCPYLISIPFYETILLSIYDGLMEQLDTVTYLRNETEERFNALKASHTINQLINVPYDDNILKTFARINSDAKLISRLGDSPYRLEKWLTLILPSLCFMSNFSIDHLLLINSIVDWYQY